MTIKYKLPVILFIIVVLLVPGNVILKASPNMATLFLVLDKDSFLDPEILSMNIKLNSDTPANALLLGLAFDPLKLELKDLNINESLCPIVIWQDVDNENGLAHFICGSPTGINSQDEAISQLIFNKKQAGFSQLRILEYSSIVANDGQGTNIPLQREVHNIYIVK